MTSERQRAFIDIHSHFLPFLDDGAENYDHSIAAARHYLSAGFEKVIATPHFIPGSKWTPSCEQILDNIKQTENVLEQHEIPLQILPGMEIMLTDFHTSHFDPDYYLSLGDQGCYLIEFPLNTPLTVPIENLFNRLLSLQGIRCVIAHPERCRIFHENNSYLKQMIEQGMMTQVNIDSVLGLAGKKIQNKAFELLQGGLVHFLASDTHPKEYRMPPDKDIIQKLYSLLGEETTLQALKNNPQSMLDCKKVDPLVFDGNIHLLPERQFQHESYMQKLKKFIYPKKYISN